MITDIADVMVAHRMRGETARLGIRRTSSIRRHKGRVDARAAVRP